VSDRRWRRLRKEASLGWTMYDSLAGKELRPGEVIEVKWKDKSLTRHLVSVQVSRIPGVRPGDGTTSKKAHITIQHREVSVKVFLDSIQDRILLRRVPSE